ncbi:MAG: ECF transporter S component [Bacilli bacterium]|nr:ECF transporter S component [Bacilli bacterium]
MKKEDVIFKISLSGMFIALGLVLPFLTGQIPEFGNMLCPMHIPVLICGFICGWKYGLIVGFVIPLLRSLIFYMPPLYPGAIAMAFELATYGLIVGLFYELFNKLHKRGLFTNYITLIIAMIGGRIVWGLVRFILSMIDGTFNFTFDIFLSGAFITAWPGIILQLILIPILIIALDKIGVLNKKRR